MTQQESGRADIKAPEHWNPTILTAHLHSVGSEFRLSEMFLVLQANLKFHYHWKSTGGTVVQSTQ